jgi:hypothetical protein
MYCYEETLLKKSLFDSIDLCEIFVTFNQVKSFTLQIFFIGIETAAKTTEPEYHEIDSYCEKCNMACSNINEVRLVYSIAKILLASQATFFL